MYGSAPPGTAWKRGPISIVTAQSPSASVDAAALSPGPFAGPIEVGRPLARPAGPGP
jgi:hypothetical protein